MNFAKKSKTEREISKLAKLADVVIKNNVTKKMLYKKTNRFMEKI